MANKKNQELVVNLDEDFEAMMAMLDDDDIDLDFHTYIANWKMELTYEEAIDWLTNHGDDLEQLAEETDEEIIICPSFTLLFPLANKMMDSTLFLGAQNCAPEERGAFTGEESVLTLKELGCNYCIVGHSERRRHFNETDEMIAKKIQLLMQHEIEPILCVGETWEQYQKGKTKDVLIQQVDSALSNVKSEEFGLLIIAYEPVWAVGTGKTPKIDELKEITEWLREYATSSFPDLFIDIFYGGSITDKNASELKSIGLDGFLIGKSSTDFNMLKKIILAE